MVTKKIAPPRSIWITVATDQGEVFERIDAGAYDLSRPLAGGSLMQDIRTAVAQVRARYESEAKRK